MNKHIQEKYIKIYKSAQRELRLKRSANREVNLRFIFIQKYTKNTAILTKTVILLI